MAGGGGLSLGGVRSLVVEGFEVGFVLLRNAV